MKMHHLSLHRMPVMTLLLGCLMVTGSVMAQLKDTFSDSSVYSNSEGTGGGFSSQGTTGVNESGGYVNMTGSGYNTMVISSNEAIDPYQDAATTTTWKFGSITYDASWQRFWVGYRLGGINYNHFYPDNPNQQGLYVAIVSNTGSENNYTYKGNLVAHNGSSRTILASWNWSDLNQLSGLVVSLTTTATSYNLAFSGAAATPTYVFGAASGTLTGIGSLGNTYNVGVHNQAASGSTVQVDEIVVSTGVTTRAATAITTAGATLNGTSFPSGLATTAWFEYGTSPTLSGAASTTAQTMGSGSSGVDYSQDVTGLSANTTYYFRAVENSSSGTRQGTILSFITGPEIVVEQPVGAALTDGVTSLSFSSAESVAGTSRTFTITNTGGVALTGLSATVDGDFPGDYALSTLSTSTLEAGASTTLTVTFTAGAIGTRGAVLHIASNDADENPFDITLTGKGVNAVPGYVWSGNFPNYGSARDVIYGSHFTAMDSCTLTHLGVYDHDQDGLTQAIPVGLWDATTQQLLASTTVSSGTGDPLFGSCRQHALDTPVVLETGKRYVVAAFYPSNSNDYFGYSGQITTDERVAYYGYAYYYSSQLTYPYYNGSGSTSSADYFGASFMLDTTAAAPAVTTQAPSVEDAGISLRARVNPNSRATSVTFEYSLDATLSTGVTTTAAQNLAAGYVGQVVSSSLITGLPANTTFYVRAVAVNSLGTTVGAIRSFSTSPPVPGYKFSGNASNYQTQYYYDSNWGSYFTTTKACTLTHLGVYDHDQNGLGADIPVGIWDSNGTLLGSTTVRSGTTDEGIGSFRYRALNAPVNLAASTRYFIAAYYTSYAPDQIGYGVNLQTDSRIIYEGYTNKHYAGQLSFPGSYSYGSTSAGSALYFGAGFLLESQLPEAPSVVTSSAGVNGTDVTFNASVWPNGLSTQVTFQYSLDPGMSSGVSTTAAQTLGSTGFDPVTVSSAAITGLPSGTLYYVRAVATNSEGTTNGEILPFNTTPSPAGYKWTGNLAGFSTDGSNRVWGSTFTALEDCVLTHLGVYDHNQDGLSRSVPVGLWDYNTQQLLASTTVTTSDPLVGSSRQHALTTPVTLTAGTRYTIGAFYPGGSQDYYGYGSPIVTDYRVAYNGYATIYNPSGLTYPSEQGNASAASAQYFGATYLLQAPAPSAPYIVTNAPAVTDAGVEFKATVRSNGLPAHVSFEYSLDNTLSTGVATTASQLSLAGFDNLSVSSAAITGLPANTTFYVRAVAVNSLGMTMGAIRSFSTSPPVPGYKFSGNASNYQTQYYYDNNWGSYFTTTKACTLTHLGVYDHDQNGLGADIPVGIWDSNGTLLGSTTVRSGTTDERIGSFRYRALNAPVSLAASTRYFIAAYYTSYAPDQIGYGVNLQTDSRIIYEGYANNYYAGQLSFPGSYNYGSTSASSAQYFGAGFLLEAPSPEAPNVTTLEADVDPQTSAAPAAKVLTNGLPTQLSFEYSLDPSLTTGVSTTPVQNLPASYDAATLSSAPIYGLTSNSTYYYRAVATNSLGTAQGAVLSFQTNPSLSGYKLGSFASYGTNAGYNWGSEFTALTDTSITHLGVYDHEQNGLQGDVVVGLWDTNGNLLASTTVTSSDSLVGTSRYRLLSSPVSLSASTRYLLSAYYTSHDPIGEGPVTTDNRVAYYGYAYYTGNYYGGLQFPHYRGQTGNPSYSYYFGPNFLLEEPVAQAPAVSTRRAFMRQGGATLNASVRPGLLPTQVTFEYSTDPSLSTSVSTTAAQTVIGYNPKSVASAPVGGLPENSLVYYRAVVTNTMGTAYGDILSFKTSGAVWNGPPITFAKLPYSDWTQEANQDRLSPNTWLTRASTQGLFNIAQQNSYVQHTSPSNTEWAAGTTANLTNLRFSSWYDWWGRNLSVLRGTNAVLHLIDEDIYIDIRFDSWTQASGGGFSYTRSTPGDSVVASSPEIALSGNGLDIVNGDSTPGTADHTDFEGTPAVSGAVTRTFTITNSGAVELSLTGASPNLVTLGGANAADFTVTAQPTTPVAANGGTTTFQVSFDPSAIGTRTATVSVASNDSTDNPFTFTIQGTGMNSIPTDITLSSASILENNTAGATVGTLAAVDADVGQTHSFSLVSGTGDTDNASFSISGSSLNIAVVASHAAKGSYSIRVQADDGAGGVFAKVLTVTILPANQAPSFTLNVADAPPALRSWSSNDHGVGTVPAGLTSILDFSANGVHNLALKSDGTVAAWGNNGSGQSNVPAGLNNVIDVASGYDHNLALKGDGTVVAWGSNSQGQTTVPAGLTGVTAVAGGGFHSLALKADGTVVAWGGNEWGQATVPAGLTGVVAIGAARNHSLALKADGTVVAWGDNSSGQLNIPAGLANVTAISTNTYHNMALKSDGTVVVWGSNNFGERNVPAGLSGVVGIAAGGYHCLVLKSNGTVQAWGANWAGQLNIPADIGFVSRIEAGIGHNLVMSSAYPAGFGPVKVAEDSAAYALNNAAASISAGPPGESSQTLTFLVSNDNNALFSVQPAISASGTLTFTPAPDASGAALVTVRLKDDGGTASGGVDTSEPQAFTITVTPVNDLPTDITLTPASIAENNAANATVGTLAAVDVDAGQTHSFSLVSGTGDTDNGSFSIAGASLKITPSANYEVKDSYSIRVQADDGSGGTIARAFTVAVTDVNDAPVITSNGGLATAAVSVPENSTAVALVSAEDADLPAQTVSYSLDGVDAAFFTINASSGALGFIASPDYEAPLDHNADNTYLVTVIASDNGSPPASSSQQVAVTVTDVPEFPEITVLGNGSEIVSGDSTPSALDGTDFGNVLLATSLSRGFTVTNTDVALLGLTGAPQVEISGVHASNFAVTAQPSASVAPLTGQTSFTIRFIPTGSGLRTALVTLRSNDPDEGVYTFAIQGTGYANNGGRVFFAPPAYVVNQGSTQVVLTVKRVDGKAATSVRLTTAPGTTGAAYTAGAAGVDYVHQDVLVNFAENATSQQVTIPLIARTGAQPSYQFSASLSNPDQRTTIGTPSQATISIKANTLPRVGGVIPKQGAVISDQAPYKVSGYVLDLDKAGINRVEVRLNGGAPVNATLTSSGGFNLEVMPVNGANTLEVTAVDNRGTPSLPVSVTFTFARRYKLEVPRSTFGTVVAAATPASAMAAVAKTVYMSVLPGAAVKLTANARAGATADFSHWTGLPEGADAKGNVVTFAMPAQDVLGIGAVFNPNSFKAPSGHGNTFYGFLKPGSPSLNRLSNLAFLTGTMTDTGAFTGKILIEGASKPLSAQFYGNGTSTFGTSRLASLDLGVGSKLSMTFVGGNIEASLSNFTGSTVFATGTARRIIYSKVRVIPSAFRNATSAGSLGMLDSGFFSIAMPAKAQDPVRDTSTYPQGDGFGTINLTKDGLVTFAGTLADGSKFTASTGLVQDNHAPFMAQMLTPGSLARKEAVLGGGLVFDTAPASSDVTATDLIWIRPSVSQKSTDSLTQLYTDGWYNGIHVDAIGALYSKNRSIFASLEFGVPFATSGGGELCFSAGKLNPEVSVTSFSVNRLDEVVKAPLTNTSFTLTLSPSSASFSGTFTPNWSAASKTKPGFKGIILQKGESKGGYGFFISNRVNDLDPESGRVTFGPQ
ncbi:MAG: hypothetical protein CJBNEKGG_02620 [Prosthecobacter sp.]|nr:hypothetical protein [Prosthecobacter sp.]